MQLELNSQNKIPKRILALDGGGIRGALTLGYLEKIEQILRERYKNPQLKLCEYFDLIGGTSTGSIIAAGLAIGMDVSEVRQMYLDVGEKVFTRNKPWKWLKAFFDAKNLRDQLKIVFKDITLGSDKIKTGLCVFTKRVDTGGTWIFINHPEGKYFKDNKDILLRRLIRASTAAPTYFEPETLDIKRGQRGVFIDGGVSMVNNPALMMFIISSLSGFPYKWKTGEDKILLVSVGTGAWQLSNDVDSITGARLTTWARKIPSMLMYDASQQNQMLLHLLSKSQTPLIINREIGDLSEDIIGEKPVMTYLRYNAFLDENGLNELGLFNLIPKLDSLRDMSIGKNRFDLAKIGEEAAKRHVLSEHFSGIFDNQQN